MRIFLILFLSPFIGFSQLNDPLLDYDYISQEKWVDSIYNNLSLEEKIGQLFVVWASPDKGEDHYKEIKRMITKNKIGGIIFSLGSPNSHIDWLNSFQDLSDIPLLISINPSHGI